MRVGVIGSTGQLGSEVVRALRDTGHHALPLTHVEIDVADAGSVRSALEPLRPDVVVNCAAYVRVDEAEDRAEEAFRANALGALRTARAAADLDALCVYVSTDYVFDGQKATPYAEDDTPRPINVYGASKLAGEVLVQQACPRWLIVRTAGLFGARGARGKGSNFVESIIARARQGQPVTVVDDVRTSPTYARDFSTALMYLLEHEVTGIVHLANAGTCTWFEFAEAIIRDVGMAVVPQRISSDELGARARRPRQSALTSGRAADLKMEELRPWRAALQAYLLETGHITADRPAAPEGIPS